MAGFDDVQESSEANFFMAFFSLPELSLGSHSKLHKKHCIKLMNTYMENEKKNTILLGSCYTIEGIISKGYWTGPCKSGPPFSPHRLLPIPCTHTP